MGAIGPPGQRVFYLQARQADRLMSLKLEKEQVLFLAGGLTEVMADLAAPVGVPAESELELEQPVLAEWAVGSMQLAYDSAADRVLLVAREVADDEDDADTTGPNEGGPAEGDPHHHAPDEMGRNEVGPNEIGADDNGPGDSGPTGPSPGDFDVSAGWAALEADDPRSSSSAVARLALTREQAAGVIEHGKRLLRKGRPPCPLCGFPLGDDHSCPKTNGHRAPAL